MSPEPGAADEAGTSTQLMDLLAYLYLQHQRPEKAAVLLAARDLLEPGDARTLLALALARLRADQPQRALDTLDRLALLGAIDAPFHLVRAQALHALDRAPEAAAATRAYLAARDAALPAGADAA